jgi:uncharacterized protein YhaN
MSDKELKNEIENLKSDIKAHVFTHQSMAERWIRCEDAIDNHMKAIEVLRQPDAVLVEAMQRIKDLQDGYYQALSPEYCPDIRYEATEALAKYRSKQ